MRAIRSRPRRRRLLRPFLTRPPRCGVREARGVDSCSGRPPRRHETDSRATSRSPSRCQPAQEWHWSLHRCCPASHRRHARCNADAVSRITPEPCRPGRAYVYEECAGSPGVYVRARAASGLVRPAVEAVVGSVFEQAGWASVASAARCIWPWTSVRRIRKGPGRALPQRTLRWVGGRYRKRGGRRAHAA